MKITKYIYVIQEVLKMKKSKAKKYTAHMDYSIKVDSQFLNMRIRIYDMDSDKKVMVYYEGSIGKFLKERIPADWLVELLPELRTSDKISYVTSGGENFIERLK